MNVLGAESVFVAVLEEPFAGINHEDAVADVSGSLFVNNEDTGGDSSAVEQICG